MKTIAITIDEGTLRAIDAVARPSPGRRRAASRRPTRSEIVRQALQAWVQQQERLRREERERAVWDKHRDLLNRQGAALIRGQAKP